MDTTTSNTTRNDNLYRPFDKLEVCPECGSKNIVIIFDVEFEDQETFHPYVNQLTERWPLSREEIENLRPCRIERFDYWESECCDCNTFYDVFSTEYGRKVVSMEGDPRMDEEDKTTEPSQETKDKMQKVSELDRQISELVTQRDELFFGMPVRERALYERIMGI